MARPLDDVCLQVRNQALCALHDRLALDRDALGVVVLQHDRAVAELVELAGTALSGGSQMGGKSQILVEKSFKGWKEVEYEVRH